MSLGFARRLADVEDRCGRMQEAAHVAHRPQRRSTNHAERNDRQRVAVHHRLHVGARGVDGGVDESLQVGLSRVVFDRVALQIEGHDVGCRHQRRRHAAREQEAVAGARQANAHVAEAIDHALIGQDVVGVNKVIGSSRVMIAPPSCAAGSRAPACVCLLVGVEPRDDCSLDAHFCRRYVKRQGVLSDVTTRTRNLESLDDGFCPVILDVKVFCTVKRRDNDSPRRN
jgi:hypothetical protein